jgi:hypothetical protein
VVPGQVHAEHEAPPGDKPPPAPEPLAAEQ